MDLTDSASGPNDDVGHGTHTAGTAAGNFVTGAKIFGNAKGTAAGMAPLAHLAVYKVTDGIHCMGKTIFEGMQAAVADGVDVLSVSICVKSLPFYKDAIVIGAFRAIQEGIRVCCAAGNSGPFYETLSNEGPWILTVGASTVDRKMKTSVHLGNHYTDGESSFRPTDFP